MVVDNKPVGNGGNNPFGNKLPIEQPLFWGPIGYLLPAFNAIVNHPALDNMQILLLFLNIQLKIMGLLGCDLWGVFQSFVGVVVFGVDKLTPKTLLEHGD